MGHFITNWQVAIQVFIQFSMLMGGMKKIVEFFQNYFGRNYQ